MKKQYGKKCFCICNAALLSYCIYFMLHNVAKNKNRHIAIITSSSTRAYSLNYGIASAISFCFPKILEINRRISTP